MTLTQSKVVLNVRVVVNRVQQITLTDAIMINNVEENHVECSKLEKWCNTNTFCLTIFMLPAPECTATGSSKSLWRLIATSKPCTNFADFQLAKWSVSCKWNKIRKRKKTHFIFTAKIFSSRLVRLGHWLCNFVHWHSHSAHGAFIIFIFYSRFKFVLNEIAVYLRLP